MYDTSKYDFYKQHHWVKVDELFKIRQQGSCLFNKNAYIFVIKEEAEFCFCWMNNCMKEFVLNIVDRGESGSNANELNPRRKVYHNSSQYTCNLSGSVSISLLQMFTLHTIQKLKKPNSLWFLRSTITVSFVKEVFN